MASGTPIVLIPGLQGRWEWMRPAVDALARRHRVITFSLCDERTSPFPCDPEKAFENYIDQVDVALMRGRGQGSDRGRVVRRLDRDRVCRAPSRARARFDPGECAAQDVPAQQAAEPLLNAPLLMWPLFVVTAPHRMRPEMLATFPTLAAAELHGHPHV